MTMKRIGFAPGKSFGFADDGTPRSFGCSKMEAFEFMENESAALPAEKIQEAVRWLNALRQELELEAARHRKIEQQQRDAEQKNQTLLWICQELLAREKYRRRPRLPRYYFF